MAQHNTADSYFISLDFQKAFDTIEYKWLNLVLQFQNFPLTFCKYIAQIQHHASSQIQVNQFITNPVPIKRGVRQDDPLSLTIFILALNPLLTYIQENRYISPVPNPTKYPPKLTAYADDITLSISKPLSLKEVFKTITLLQKASGLQLSPTKSTGVSTNKKLKLSNDFNIHWHSDCITPLNITIVSPQPVA